MVIAARSSLLRRVQAAMERADAEFHSNPAIPHRSRHLARAALDACHAEEMRDVIDLLVYAKDMKDRSGDTPAYRATKEEGWARARAILAKLDGQP